MLGHMDPPAQLACTFDPHQEPDDDTQRVFDPLKFDTAGHTVRGIELVELEPDDFRAEQDPEHNKPVFAVRQEQNNENPKHNAT